MRSMSAVLGLLAAGAAFPSGAFAGDNGPAPAGQATYATTNLDDVPARMTLTDKLSPPDQDPNAPKPKTLDDKVEDLRKSLPFDMHGGAYLYYYQPFGDNLGKNDFNLYAAWLTLDAKADDFAFHWEERFRDTPLRPFFQSNIWTQEIYGSWKTPEIDGVGSLGTLKMGKVYTRFGYFWDDSFYGAIQYFDGFKLASEYGFSFENTLRASSSVDLNYAVQFFVEDGRTNGSLGIDTTARDTIGDKANNGHKRNDVIARLAPTIHVHDDLSVTPGLSVQDFRADFTSPTLGGAALDDVVTRWAAELEVQWRSLVVFGEYDQQHGAAVNQDPAGNSPPSREVTYWWAGARYTWDFVTLRYSVSAGNYVETNYHELLHLAGVVFALQKHVSLWFEYAGWRSHELGHDGTIDSSLNVVLDLHF